MAPRIRQFILQSSKSPLITKWPSSIRCKKLRSQTSLSGLDLRQIYFFKKKNLIICFKITFSPLYFKHKNGNIFTNLLQFRKPKFVLTSLTTTDFPSFSAVLIRLNPLAETKEVRISENKFEYFKYCCCRVANFTLRCHFLIKIQITDEFCKKKF